MWDRELLEIITNVIKTGDVGFVKVNVEYKPELRNIIRDKIVLAGLLDSYELDPEMINLLIEYGLRLKNSYDIVALIREFGVEDIRSILDYRTEEIDDPKGMIEDLYDHSLEALEWLRDSGIPDVFPDHEILMVAQEPDVEKVALFFSTPPHAEEGERWWPTIYYDFPLGDLVNLTGGYRRVDRSLLRDPEWKKQISEIVDLFYDNIQTPEEYEIMKTFADANPDYELPERSLDPSYD